MSDRRKARVGWALFGLIVLSSAISAWMDYPYHDLARSLKFVGNCGPLVGAPPVFAGGQALIISRLPRNTLGRLLLAPALPIAALVGPLRRLTWTGVGLSMIGMPVQ
ncbi:MAG: hypothetical protein N2378_03720 [Chloroflexaceae bacterium]|nr:hypothetical protein [Chloroflexaceae bacterium]